jgi:putative PIN family toxin of toxin-antitoxin system
MKPRAVIDTNVFISALRSSRGASFKLLELIGHNRFKLCVSVPLILEYESAAKRVSRSLGFRHSDIGDILDYLCSEAEHREIFYLWRPFLKDPGDDMVLELAVEAEADYIVTHNIRDFARIELFGIKAFTPQEFLRDLGEIK